MSRYDGRVIRKLAAALILEDGKPYELGELLVSVEGRKGFGDMLAGGLVLPGLHPLAVLETLVDVFLNGSPRMWRLVEEDGTRWRGRYYLETLNRAGETRIAELTLAGTGEPLQEDQEP